MSKIEFQEEQSCPSCGGRFSSAERREEYDPIAVLTCPHCSKMLWRPGLDDSSRLFPFDPDQDKGGI